MHRPVKETLRVVVIILYCNGLQILTISRAEMLKEGLRGVWLVSILLCYVLSCATKLVCNAGLSRLTISPLDGDHGEGHDTCRMSRGIVQYLVENILAVRNTVPSYDGVWTANLSLC